MMTGGIEMESILIKEPSTTYIWISSCFYDYGTNFLRHVPHYFIESAKTLLP
jgi:hypothetical protein